MRLIIELLTRDAGTGDARDDTYYAIARYDGMVVGKAGVGSGTERAAAQEAINSFYARQQAEALWRDQSPIGEPSVVPSTDPVAPAAVSILDRRVETTERGILAFLREAIGMDTKPLLSMTYIDARDAETERTIIPFEIEDKAAPTFPVPTYLKAIDADKDEPRTFRLDRIAKLETV